MSPNINNITVTESKCTCEGLRHFSLSVLVCCGATGTCEDEFMCHVSRKSELMFIQ